MTPIHSVTLDSDAETLLRKHGVIIVGGQCLHCGPRVSWHHEMDCGTPLDPPSWAVTATEPCECHGTERCYVEHGVLTLASFDDCVLEPCQDCHEGRPVIEVRTACVRCKAHGSGWCCIRPDSSFWMVGEVLPIVQTEGSRGLGEKVTVSITSGIGGTGWSVWHWRNEHDNAPLQLLSHFQGPEAEYDPADLIGKYALMGCEEIK